MSQVEELQVRIRDLPEKDFSKLREWFFQLEDELWDQQISADFRAGKFNRLIFTPGESRARLSSLTHAKIGLRYLRKREF